MRRLGVGCTAALIWLASSAHAQIFYKDAGGTVFGPFPVEYISAWHQQGHLTDETPLSTHPQGTFQQLRAFFAVEAPQAQQQQEQQGPPSSSSFDSQFSQPPTTTQDQAQEVSGFDSAPHAESDGQYERSHYGAVSNEGEMQATLLDHESPPQTQELPQASVSVNSMHTPPSASFLLPELTEEEDSNGDAGVRSKQSTSLATRLNNGLAHLLLPPAFRNLPGALRVACKAAPVAAFLLVLLRALESIVLPILTGYIPMYISMGMNAAASASANIATETSIPAAAEAIQAAFSPQFLSFMLRRWQLAGQQLQQHLVTHLRASPRLLLPPIAVVSILSLLHTTVYPYLEAKLAVYTTQAIQDRLLLDNRNFPSGVIEAAGAVGVYLRESLRTASALSSTLVCAVLIQAFMLASAQPGSMQHSLRWWPFLPFIAINIAFRFAGTAQAPGRIASDAVKSLRRYQFVRDKLVVDGQHNNLPSDWTFGSRLKPLYSYYKRQLPRSVRNLPMRRQGLSSREAIVGTVVGASVIAWLVCQAALTLPFSSISVGAASVSELSGLHRMLRHIGLLSDSKQIAPLAAILLALLATHFSIAPLISLPTLRRVYWDAVASLDAYSQAGPKKARNMLTHDYQYSAADSSAGIHVTGLSVVGPQGPILQNVNMHLPAGQLAIVYGGAGSGKTTLLETLSNQLNRNALQLSNGAIFMFGQKVRAWSQEFLREKLYYMRQQEAPLGLPLDAVVRLQSPASRTLTSSQQAAEMLTAGGALDLPKFLREGLETDFSDPTAPHLTPGLWRKLAVARALFHAQTADVLLLDAPTDALTEEEEHLFFQFLRKQLRPNQVIVVTTTKAHLRKHADVVVDLDQHATYTTQRNAQAAQFRPQTSAHQALAATNIAQPSSFKAVR